MSEALVALSTVDCSVLVLTGCVASGLVSLDLAPTGELGRVSDVSFFADTSSFFSKLTSFESFGNKAFDAAIEEFVLEAGDVLAVSLFSFKFSLSSAARLFFWLTGF